MRLDRFISRHSTLSRKDATRALRRGRVAVDGVTARDGKLEIAPDRVRVTLDGAPLVAAERYVVMLHKPAGVVSATRDRRFRTVVDLVPDAIAPRALVPVGRLDRDATGLMLLTDDGALVHALTHPKRGVDKGYDVTFEGELAPDAAARFAAGLSLADGTRCRPARLEIHGEGRAHVTIHEGRHHQVKRMIAAIGGRVATLHRARVGPIHLDPELAPGEARRLTEAELAELDPHLS